MSLFGTKRTGGAMVGIAVAFGVWSQVSSCQADQKIKAQDEYNLRMATPSGAIDYCKKWLIERDGDRSAFRMTNWTADRRATPYAL